MVGEWCDAVKGETLKSFETSGWKECPDGVDEERRYSVDKKTPRVATMVGSGLCTTVTWSASLPLNTVTSWSIKILKSRDNGGGHTFVGVAPSDIDQNEDVNRKKCGWYFGCYRSKLWSGPPQNCFRTEYGPRKKDGQYVHTGDSVGVVMDTAKGELSFALNGVNLGVAYRGILLDKPLVPCVLLGNEGDSVEFVF